MPELTDQELQRRLDEAREEGRRQAELAAAPQNRYALSAELAATPSDPPVFEVLVDTWGTSPTFSKFDRVEEGDCPYDLAWAERQGVIRRLSQGEVMVAPPHPTMPLTLDNQAIDEAQLAGVRYHSGFRGPQDTGAISGPNGEPVTVTFGEGPPEPDGYEKPTLAGPRGNQQPPANPVIVLPDDASIERAVAAYFEKNPPQAEVAAARRNTRRVARGSARRSGRREGSAGAEKGGASKPESAKPPSTPPGSNANTPPSSSASNNPPNTPDKAP